MAMNEQIEKGFTKRCTMVGSSSTGTALWNHAKELALLVDELCPEGREKSLAITKIEESVMWANAAIARGE